MRFVVSIWTWWLLLPGAITTNPGKGAGGPTDFHVCNPRARSVIRMEKAPRYGSDIFHQCGKDILMIYEYPSKAVYEFLLASCSILQLCTGQMPNVRLISSNVGARRFYVCMRKVMRLQLVIGTPIMSWIGHLNVSIYEIERRLHKIAVHCVYRTITETEFVLDIDIMLMSIRWLIRLLF